MEPRNRKGIVKKLRKEVRLDQETIENLQYQADLDPRPIRDYMEFVLIEQGKKKPAPKNVKKWFFFIWQA